MTSIQVYRKGIKIGERFLLDIALNIHEKGFSIPKTISDCKRSEKPEIFCVSKLRIWCQKLVASVRHDATRS